MDIIKLDTLNHIDLESITTYLLLGKKHQVCINFSSRNINDSKAPLFLPEIWYNLHKYDVLIA